MEPITRAFDAALEVSAGERSVVARINTAAVDRYKTVIDPAGVNLKSYEANPVVLWNHGEGNDGKPVGRNAWIRHSKSDKALLAKTLFFDDEFSDGIFRLYQAGGLRAFSVNIVPDMARCSSPTADEIRKRPELAECYLMFRSSDLAEYSAVSVPGNPEALTMAVSRGLMLPDRLRRDLSLPGVFAEPPITTSTTAPSISLSGLTTEPTYPRLVGRTLAEASQAAIDTIRARTRIEADRAVRDRLDLLRGRV